ncbi:hypothetical protein D3C81_632570 [compost metagenome]
MPAPVIFVSKMYAASVWLKFKLPAPAPKRSSPASSVPAASAVSPTAPPMFTVPVAVVDRATSTKPLPWLTDTLPPSATDRMPQLALPTERRSLLLQVEFVPVTVTRPPLPLT